MWKPTVLRAQCEKCNWGPSEAVVTLILWQKRSIKVTSADSSFTACPSATRGEGSGTWPGHLSPVPPHKHEAQSLSGGSSGRTGGRGAVERGAHAGKKKKSVGRDIKGEGVGWGCPPRRPTRRGTGLGPSLRTGIWLRCAKIKRRQNHQ